MDGGPRLERQCRPGCRRKQSTFRLSGQTRDARSAQAAYHRAMGFPEGLRPRSRRWTLLLSQELRSAAPVGIVRAGELAGGAVGRTRSEDAFARLIAMAFRLYSSTF